MTTMNPLAAQFINGPVLFSRSHRAEIAACINAVAEHPHFAEMMADQGYNDDGFWTDDDWRSCFRPYVVTSEGVLLIPVKGVLLHNFGYQFGNYATGYNYIWRAFERGCQDPLVKGIAFVEHSPGGMVAGLYEMANKILAAKAESGKPVRAFAQEYAYSAAYAIFSLADHGTVSATGGVGSIGTLLVHEDWSKFNENLGVDPTYLATGKHKADGNADEPLSDEVKAHIMERLTELNEMFIALVAEGRKLDPQAVRDFEAQTFTASQSLSNGLADAVGWFDDALAAFAADLSEPSGDPEMSTQDTSAEHQAAIDAAVTAANATAATALEAAVATARAEAVTAERARVSAILGNAEATGRSDLASHLALETDTAAEAAVAILAKSPKTAESGAGAFDAAMGGSGGDVGAGDGNGENQIESADATLALARQFGVKGVRPAQTH